MPRNDHAPALTYPNVVVFLFDNSVDVADSASALVPAEADDSIVQAWRRVFRQRRIAAERVTAISAQWEPSVRDKQFMQQNFPNLGETRTIMGRPERAEDWVQAQQTLRKILDSAAEQLEQQEGPLRDIEPATPPSDYINTVAFAFANLQVAVAHVPAAADDAVEQAWREMQRQRGVSGDEVTAISAHWDPSEHDKQFIERTFPNLRRLQALVERPDPGDAVAWARAEEELRHRLAAGEDELTSAETADPPEEYGEQRPDSLAGEDEDPRFVFLPMLRTTPPPPGVITHTLIPNELHLGVGWVIPTDEKLDIRWASTELLVDLGDIDFAELLDIARQSLAESLRILATGEDDEVRMLQLKGPSTMYMPAAAVTLPDFHQHMADHLGGESFLAAIPCHDHLYVMRADTPMPHLLDEILREHEHVEDELAPTLLLIDADGLHLATR